MTSCLSSSKWTSPFLLNGSSIITTRKLGSHVLLVFSSSNALSDPGSEKAFIECLRVSNALRLPPEYNFVSRELNSYFMGDIVDHGNAKETT